MSHLNKQNFLTNQIKTLDDLDHYITLLTLKTHQKLGLYETQNGINHSQAQEQVNRFYNLLKDFLEKQVDRRKACANLPIEKTSCTKKFDIATTGVGSVACLTAGTILIKDLDKTVGQELCEKIEGLGGIMLLAASMPLTVLTVFQVNDCIKDRKSKRDYKQAGKYLHEDSCSIIKLICSLCTLYNLERLTQSTNLNESQINRIARKECGRLLKNLAKKDRKLPHRIADKLLGARSFTPDYALEKRISLLRHWFGALEARIKKDRPSKELSLFLNKLDTLDQKIEWRKSEYRLNKPTGLHATNPNNLFSLPKNNEPLIEKSNEKNTVFH